MADEPGDKPPAEVQSNEHVKAFFLDLAAKGKDAWNAWRRDPANKDVHVTFAGIDFSEAPRDQIDFSGFEFGDSANFSQCKWRGVKWAAIEEDPEAFAPGRACFTGAAFGNRASFDVAVFGTNARFDGAAFGYGASFDGAAFGHSASFDGAAFGSGATFIGAVFGSASRFAYTTFGDGATFTIATFGTFAVFVGAGFGDLAIFAGAAFGAFARFNDTFFKGRVILIGTSEEQWSGYLEATDDDADEKLKEARLKEARPALKKRHKESWTSSDSGPDRFSTISFARARFDGTADFSGRSFDKTADFTNARFYYPPDFDATTNASRIDFTGAHIGFVPLGRRAWTKGSQVPVRLRAFRKIAEETKNHDLERDLYIEERKAERGVYWHQLVEELKKAPEELKRKLEVIDEQQKEVWSNSRHKACARNAHRLGIAIKFARLAVHGLWIVVMGVYWALADYGRSFVRPAVWLIASGFFFYWRYTEVLAQLMAKAPDIEKYKQAVRMLALGNTVPFVGPLTIDSEIKRLLFCPGCNDKIPAIAPEGYQFLVLGQNLFSITCVFFIGLALRNYFRIK